MITDNMVLTAESVKYILRHMMNTDWQPSFIEIPTWESRKSWEADQKKILQILGQCQSKLEVMYFLGIGYYLHKMALETAQAMIIHLSGLVNIRSKKEYISVNPFAAEHMGMGYPRYLLSLSIVLQKSLFIMISAYSQVRAMAAVPGTSLEQ